MLDSMRCTVFRRLESCGINLEIGASDLWAEAGARKIPLYLYLSSKKVDYRWT